MKNLVNCKRCNATDLHWKQDWRGKWQLLDKLGSLHSCEEGSVKNVTCKYCKAEDLHWVEEINPNTKRIRMILNESYGLPHACDARIAHIAKEKKEKKDKYEAEKKRINDMPDGPCKGIVMYHYSCPDCYGMGQFNSYTRKAMIDIARSKIWPGYKKAYY